MFYFQTLYLGVQIRLPLHAVQMVLMARLGQKVRTRPRGLMDPRVRPRHVGLLDPEARTRHAGPKVLQVHLHPVLLLVRQGRLVLK